MRAKGLVVRVYLLIQVGSHFSVMILTLGRGMTHLCAS